MLHVHEDWMLLMVDGQSGQTEMYIYQYVDISKHASRILQVSSSANANTQLHVTECIHQLANPIKCDLCIHRIIVVAHHTGHFSLPLVVTQINRATPVAQVFDVNAVLLPTLHLYENFCGVDARDDAVHVFLRSL